MSDKNIGAGERSLLKIADELEGTTFGIIVVTPENQESQWLNYEAGALSKGLYDQTVRVAPSLVGFRSQGDASGPISQFHANLLDYNGIESILAEIAKIAEIDLAAVRKRFHYAWDAEYKEVFAQASADLERKAPKRRPQWEMLDEILALVRRTAGPQLPPEQRLSIPLDFPLEQVRAIVERFIGPGQEVSVTISSTEDGIPQVVIPVEFPDSPIAATFMELGNALMREAGVASVYPVVPKDDVSRDSR